jgi:hypothetical protein
MKFLSKEKKRAPFCPAGSKTPPTRITTNIKQIMRISATIIFLIGISSLTLMADAGKAQKLNGMKVSLNC